MKQRKREKEREIRIPIHRVNDELINKSREREGGIREMMMLMMISWKIGPPLAVRQSVVR